MQPVKLFVVVLAALLLTLPSVITQELPAKTPAAPTAGKQRVVGPADEDERLLADPDPEVRLKVALRLAKANDSTAVPVLIDLLTVLPATQRQQVEEALQELAGEWAPIGGPAAQDEISLRIRKGAWAVWWSTTDGPALLEMLRKRILTAEEQQKVKQAIDRLGDPSYQVRDKTTVELVARGRMILPMLRDALNHDDPEVAQRAKHCIQRIEQEPGNRLPPVALRMLALRKPAGAAETLLAYLPFAEEEVLDELQLALAVVAQRDGKPEPALVKAVADAQPMVRTAAGEALAKNGGPDALPAVRKLLADADLNVRLRVAQALAPRDAQAIPVLIDLMARLPGDQAWEVHDLLSRLANDKTPPGPKDSAEERKKASAAWAAWWKENSAKADRAKLADVRQHFLGYTVICEHNTGKIFELDRDRKIRWSFTGPIAPVDVCVLPNNHVLIAEFGGSRVTERDFRGNILWEKKTNGCPRWVQRLPNGNTLITIQGAAAAIIEVDRNGKEVMTIRRLTNGAYKDRKGNIICIDDAGVCARLDSAGKQLSSFAANRGAYLYDVLPNGRILLSWNHKVFVHDLQGKLLHEVNAPAVTSATGSANGHIISVCYNTNRLMELNQKGEIIWQYNAQQPFLARMR